MNPKLRLAMSSYYLPSESKIGAGFQAHGLAQALARRGHDVTMFSPCRRPDDARYNHVHVPLSGRFRTFRWPARIRELDLRDFDIFHAAGDDYLLFGRPRPGHVRTLYGSCFSEALHIRGFVERLRMLMLGVGEAIGTLAADRSVAISANTCRSYPWVRDVIPCGVDLGLFRPGGDRSDAPVILFVGTYGRRKRGRLLMEAFVNEVLPAVPSAELWMVCSDAPPAPGVKVLGFLSGVELADCYRRAWVFCLPSSYEGFGVPYIEAMASGLPIVATPNAGALEVSHNGRFNVTTPADRLGPTLVELLQDERRRAALAEAGLHQVQRYGWDTVAGEYEALYIELLTERRPTRRSLRTLSG
jgi:phosphatidylinositol alpha-mannosyltransferase